MGIRRMLPPRPSPTRPWGDTATRPCDSDSGGATVIADASPTASTELVLWCDTDGTIAARFRSAAVCRR